LENKMLKKSCREHAEALVEYAEGKLPAEATALHLNSCSDCQDRLAELRQIFAVMSTPRFSAPAAMVRAAKAIMTPRVASMRLLRTSLQLSGARYTGQDFQAIFGHDESEIRVMYSPIDQGWEVTGRLPGSEWQVRRASEMLSTDSDGRFFFTTHSLAESGFTAISGGIQLEVPAGSTVTDSDETGGDDRNGDERNKSGHRL